MERMQINWMQKSNSYYKDFCISGYASVFDVVDSHNDIIVKGAFDSTIRSRAEKIKLLWQHDPKFPIGKITQIYEDAYGLYIEASITSGTEKGREAIDLFSKNIINGLSIGFNTQKSYIREDNKRIITELELWEISVVTFPANYLSEAIAIEASQKRFVSVLEDAALYISQINKRSKNG